ncbi:MAG TPA: glycosyl hydrolase family 18 protein, partial [Terrimicrobiaceae bacterium]
AFADKREAFVEQILAEVEKYGMNGVEIDLESERDGLTSEDRSAYAAFVTALAKELHSRGKILTLSSLAGRWFGPNNTWWQDWANVVDGIQSMGYSEVGKAGTQDWDSYQAQVSLWIKAGGDPKKFANGVSVYLKHWKGGSVEENLAALYDVAQATGSGVAIWELSCSAHPEAVDPGWSTSANWDWIRKIREVTGPAKVDTTRSPRAP